MKAEFMIAVLAAAAVAAPAVAQKVFDRDTVKTSKGDVAITCVGHASLILTHNGTVIHADPWSAQADYSTLPKADVILITHEHRDHLDSSALAHIVKSSTVCVTTSTVSGQWKPDGAVVLADGKQAGVFEAGAPPKSPGVVVLGNGQSATVLGIRVEAVPAYNIVHKRPDSGEPFHPKGRGNGYILTIGDKKIYIAGDTENVPEMKALKGIDVAFLPMNIPYTMTPEMTADAAKGFKPKILYPYHYGDTDTNKLKELLKNEKGIELRIRKF